MNGVLETKPIVPSEQWVVSFGFQNSDRRKHQLFDLVEAGKSTVKAFLENGSVQIVLIPYEKDSPITLAAFAAEGENRFQLVWRGYRVELRNGEDLLDEEWPIGTCFHTKEAEIQVFSDCVTAVGYTSALPDEIEKTESLMEAQYWSPKEGVINVGDCMPFYDGEQFRLYYLKDRNSHSSKWGLGAHQYAQISSRDLVNWTVHPLAIPITHQWEGSICTGSVLKSGKLYYAFYAVRMSDRTSAKISWATSEDGIHFAKSEVYFSLHSPYETTSVRDPEVFLGEDGRYHMLVTTSWLEAPQERNGCLAHLVSDNLTDWRELSPFLVPGYPDQPECSNYFCWNGWYYLIFGNYGLSKYRYSRNPFGPWEKPAQEYVGSPCYRVPKTAAFGKNRRIASGFLANSVEGNSYAGSVVFTELIQNEDGTLGTKFVPEMDGLCETKELAYSIQTELTMPYCRRPIVELSNHFGFDAKMSAQDINTTFGFTLEFADGLAYEIRIEPFRGKVAVYSPADNPFGEYPNRTLYQVEGLLADVTLRIRFRKNILHLCVNDNRTLVCRLNGAEGKCRIGSFSKDGSCAFQMTYEK